MKKKVFLVYLFIGFVLTTASHFASAKESEEFAEKVIREHHLSGQGADRLRHILTQAPGITRNIGTEDPNALQGPNHSWHMASRAQCVERVLAKGLIKPNKQYEAVCKAKWMAPILDYPGQPVSEARTCIDQFEFPDIPCEYPMVWSPAPITKAICESMGKRVCNSHEWEGACAGSLDNHDPYRFALSSLTQRKVEYNKSRQHVWTFNWMKEFSDLQETRRICGVYSSGDPDLSSPMSENPSAYYTPLGKSLTCQQGPQSDYYTCGTNTWPSGFKYLCRSAQDVFDMHGNVAEVTNFPTSPEGVAHGTTSDMTERKGSFFVYRREYPDDCRVRQPYEHFHQFNNDSMAYYQEGFRCCKDVK